MTLRENFEAQQKDFQDYVDLWQKAQDDGIFKDAPGQVTPSQQTSTGSFFGMQNTNPSEAPSDVDAEYWRSLHQAGEGNPSQLITDHQRSLAGVPMNEETVKHWKQPPNPTPIETLGKDQDVTLGPLGHTYSEEELLELAEMKKKLYELENKANGALVFKGQKDQSKYRTEIEGIIKRIDKLSTLMGHSIVADGVDVQ